MSGKNQDANSFFAIKNQCPICEGSGQVEVCSTNEQVCDKMPCAHCNGKGYLVEYNKGRMALVAIAVGVIVIASIFILNIA